jgi:hypothetical protein
MNVKEFGKELHNRAEEFIGDNEKRAVIALVMEDDGDETVVSGTVQGKGSVIVGTLENAIKDKKNDFGRLIIQAYCKVELLKSLDKFAAMLDETDADDDNEQGKEDNNE